MKIELVEEVKRHDVWGCEIRINTEDRLRKAKAIAVMRKYSSRTFKIFEDNKLVEVRTI